MVGVGGSDAVAGHSCSLRSMWTGGAGRRVGAESRFFRFSARQSALSAKDAWFLRDVLDRQERMENVTRPLIEHPNTYELPLNGFTVVRLALDYGLELHLLAADADHAGGLVHIEGGFVLGSPSEHWEARTGPAPLFPCQVLRLFEKTISSAMATKDGRLDLRFTDGWWVQVASDPYYEPWHVQWGPGGDGLELVSVPGGELAILRPGTE